MAEENIVDFDIVEDIRTVSIKCDVKIDSKVRYGTSFAIESKVLSKLHLVASETKLVEEGVSVTPSITKLDDTKFLLVFNEAFDDADDALVPEVTVKSVRFAGVIQQPTNEPLKIEVVVEDM